jgi:hypothetical protein
MIKKTPEEVKAAKREQNREWCKNHRQQRREANRVWRETHPEKVRESAHKSNYKYRKEHSAYKQKYQETHAEEIRMSRLKYNETHREEINAANRLYRKLHPERRFMRLYGLSMEDAKQLVIARQKGVCAICGDNRSKRALVVDHDHSTGKFRGLLCHNCNVGLGQFEDDSERLRKAADYRDRNR